MRIRPGAVVLAIVVLTGGYLAGHVLVAILGGRGAIVTTYFAAALTLLYLAWTSSRKETKR